MTAWLRTIKKGDQVILWPGGAWQLASVETVERTTRTVIIVAGGRFRRDTGFEKANGPRTLAEATSEAVIDATDARDRRSLANELKFVDWQSMDLAKLRAVHEAYTGECSGPGEVDGS